jgi:hypothetical protein
MLKEFRDQGLWTVLGATAILKIVLIAIAFSLLGLPNTEWLGHTIADMNYWIGFWQKTEKGLIPYVDFEYGYPTLCGVLYWFMGKFIDLTDGRWKFIMLNHSIFMAIADIVNAGLIYLILKDINPKRALLLTGVFILSLTGLILTPVRYESYVISFVLVGYILQRRDQPLWATMVWSLGGWLKWYPFIFILVEEIRVFTIEKDRNRWWKSLGIFLGIAVICNLPFILGCIAKNGSIDTWWATYSIHVNREVSSDTVFGVVKLWLGDIKLEGLANNITVFLITLAVVLRRDLKVEYKGVIVIIASIFCNRIYSPQFNLWLYPFLLFAIAQESKKRWLIFLGLYVALDLTNIMVFPFTFADAIIEMKGLAPGLAAKSGGIATIIFSCLIMIRAALLAVLFVAMLNSYPRREERVKQLDIFDSV